MKTHIGQIVYEISRTGKPGKPPLKRVPLLVITVPTERGHVYVTTLEGSEPFRIHVDNLSDRYEQ